MTKDSVTPSTLDGIKRLAKHIKSEGGIAHAKALDRAARRAGYENFAHAKRQLDKANHSASPPKKRPGAPSGLAEYHRKARAEWDAAIDTLTGPGAPSTMVWRGKRAIASALSGFMGQGRNHAHFPTGGGHDFLDVADSIEPDCLEFKVSEGIAYVMKPSKLTLERLDTSGNSFLLLELDELEPSGVYDDDEEDEDGAEDGDSDANRGSEELLELSPGEYVDRGLWDRGFLDYDEDGREIPFPDDARIVVRWFRGKVLFVGKGSLWNGDPGTYDGRHDRMSPTQIRRLIERSLAAAA